jgi:hypothetical protein
MPASRLIGHSPVIQASKLELRNRLFFFNKRVGSCNRRDVRNGGTHRDEPVRPWPYDEAALVTAGTLVVS